MKATETTLRELLDGQKQYLIPLFQRPYSWRRQNWEALWQDVVDLYASDSLKQHFLGSIVTLGQPATAAGVNSLLLIDGQQRLTTLSVLLAAVRNKAATNQHQELGERIHGLYLVNQFARGSNLYKILPSHRDRAPYFQIVGNHGEPSASLIGEALSFFTAHLSDTIGGHAVDLERLEELLLGRLCLVSISLDPEDNVYRIFESLNGKGLQLTQADLLRNYFLMRLPAEDHEAHYREHWQPMEQRLPGRYLLDDFIRDYLVKDGEFVRGGDVYQEWKHRMDPVGVAGVADELARLSRHSEYYSRLVFPDREPDASVRARLRRLNRWGGTTSYPFLLNLYEDVTRGSLSSQDLANVLLLIESFLVRRMFANVPTNDLNRLFIRLYAQLPANVDRVEGTWAALSDPGRRWPTDEECLDDVLVYPLYTDSRPDQRKMILETLEESFEHKEKVDLAPLTIEHVMPQGLTDEWREILGPEAAEIHRTLLHTLGNLTLTGYNAPLSNLPFERKQQILRDSHLELNRQITASEVWDGPAIAGRAHSLAERVIRLWPGPRPAGPPDAQSF